MHTQRVFKVNFYMIVKQFGEGVSDTGCPTRCICLVSLLNKPRAWWEIISFPELPPSQQKWPCDKTLAAGSKCRSGSLLIKSDRWSWLCLSCLLPDFNVDVISVATAVTWKLGAGSMKTKVRKHREWQQEYMGRTWAPGGIVELSAGANDCLSPNLWPHSANESLSISKPLATSAYVYTLLKPIATWVLIPLLWNQLLQKLLTFKGCFMKLTGSGDKNSEHSRMICFCYCAWSLHWGDWNA